VGERGGEKERCFLPNFWEPRYDLKAQVFDRVGKKKRGLLIIEKGVLYHKLVETAVLGPFPCVSALILRKKKRGN